MAAYVLVEIEVTDPQLYEEYKQRAPLTIAQFGGKYLARGGAVDVLEGEWSPQRVVLVEFSSREQAHAWWDSEEYREPKALRQRSAKTKMIVLEGI